MEPVTHLLTGACLARTGFNRRAAYATLVMTIAAEFPDIDTLWGLRGPVSSFQHHRGITHTFLGIPFEAGLLVLGAFAFHKWKLRRPSRQPHSENPRSQAASGPVRWGLLYCFTLIALLSHILLDFTNNYGVRPFFPFNPHWYAGSITFILDPLMLVLLLGALVLPHLFRLVSSEVGARKQPFVARGWSVAALACIVSLWTFRAVQHNHTIDLAMSQSIATPGSSDAATPTYLQPQRALANPDPFNPFHWWMVTDFGPIYQLGEANTLAHTYTAAQQTVPKLATTPSIRAAMSSKLGRAYLDWSPMPIISAHTKQAGEVEPEDTPAGNTIVSFQDPRFMGDIPGMRGRTPLEGTVELDKQNHVVRQTMDGKEER